MLENIDFGKVDEFIEGADTAFTPGYLTDISRQTATTALNIGVKSKTQFADGMTQGIVMAKLEKLIATEADNTVRRYPWDGQVNHEFIHVYSKECYELCLRVSVHWISSLDVFFLANIKNRKKRNFMADLLKKTMCCGLPVGDILDLTEFMRECYEQEEDTDTDWYKELQDNVALFEKLMINRRKPVSVEVLKDRYKETRHLFTSRERRFVNTLLNIINKALHCKPRWRQFDDSGVMDYFEENDGWDDRLREDSLLVLSLQSGSVLNDMYFDDINNTSYLGAPCFTFSIKTKDDLRRAAQYIVLLRRCSALFDTGDKIQWTK